MGTEIWKQENTGVSLVSYNLHTKEKGLNRPFPHSPQEESTLSTARIWNQAETKPRSVGQYPSFLRHLAAGTQLQQP